MEIVNPKLEKYIFDLLPKENEVLEEMYQYGIERNFPLIGPLCGQFLRQMALVSGAKRIFEMGSGYGYSAVWFAMGMPDDGRIICTDSDPENRERAIGYFKRLGIEHKIEFHVGIAQDILLQFAGPFDIIFNDVDKEQYPETLDLAIPRLRSGGIFITDNGLWDGKVIDATGDIYTEGVKKFNQLSFSRKDLVTMIVPLRDGLVVSVKV
ncbi:MAG: O-methyltransferase [candidate division KSB1 bacterium]|nr:O-methyltransferase [candidate division KSB1 bacterium]MDZ7336227.1 O-methyltransferase [candidate division KSB1 bacterium]MDZ7357626.1 O-methyltransferase [candidate division KSB1 bacterium]MDZ7375570.1 O-methyltransferase [candidate division KSB1 bacterium]MDZ7401561.1 O-methyltransferase [candidate division KSB1 bacterium]